MEQMNIKNSILFTVVFLLVSSYAVIGSRNSEQIEDIAKSDSSSKDFVIPLLSPNEIHINKFDQIDNNNLKSIPIIEPTEHSESPTILIDHTTKVVDSTTKTEDETTNILDKSTKVAYLTTKLINSPTTLFDSTTKKVELTSEDVDKITDMFDKSTQVADLTTKTEDKTANMLDKSTKESELTTKLINSPTTLFDSTTNKVELTSNEVDETSNMLDKSTKVAESTTNLINSPTTLFDLITTKVKLTSKEVDETTNMLDKSTKVADLTTKQINASITLFDSTTKKVELTSKEVDKTTYKLDKSTKVADLTTNVITNASRTTKLVIQTTQTLLTTTTMPATTTVAPLKCYSCQYSSNPTQTGYECVTNPQDWTLGPTTIVCPSGISCSTISMHLEGELWFYKRNCQSEPDGDFNVGGILKSVRSCNRADLCNVDILLLPTTPLISTTTQLTTTTTEIPGTVSCYSCVYSYNGPGSDDSCVTKPEETGPPNKVRCPPNRYCTTISQYDKGEKVIRSFRRGCDPRTIEPGCFEDTHFTTCFQYCKGDLCNSKLNLKVPRI